jgi:hypothetical protein
MPNAHDEIQVTPEMGFGSPRNDHVYVDGSIILDLASDGFMIARLGDHSLPLVAYRNLQDNSWWLGWERRSVPDLLTAVKWMRAEIRWRLYSNEISEPF